jgi:hypothetical protein
MSWNDTALHTWDLYPDPRADIIKPILNRLNQMSLAKMAVEHIPGAKEIFNRVFAGSRPANPLGRQPIIYTGVPAFLWTQR